ncbi:alpha/beta fold hydrolase [Streptomyces sp. CA-106110]|uniref:alpha/beta fold hydrolase n=1 Tax=Streptomyces sp. CA-106110 TaxID=3240044 RepID=UPI003D918BC3
MEQGHGVGLELGRIDLHHHNRSPSPDPHRGRGQGVHHSGGGSYTHGAPDPELVSPDGYNLDNFYLARPGADEVQLDLLGDYKTNVELYPVFQHYFRTHTPALLAIWGRNDPFFLPTGAEAFKRDNPNAEVRLLDTGHFALETHAVQIAEAIREFLANHGF